MAFFADEMLDRCSKWPNWLDAKSQIDYVSVDLGGGLMERTEMEALGHALMRSVESVLDAHPGLEVVICYTFPREGAQNWDTASIVTSHATAVVTSLANTDNALRVLLHAIADIRRHLSPATGAY